MVWVYRAKEPGAGTRICPSELFTRSCEEIAGGRARVDWECQGNTVKHKATFTQVDRDYCTASSGAEAGLHFCGEVITRDYCSSGGKRGHYICPETANTGTAFTLDTTTSCDIEKEEWEPLHRGLELKRWTKDGHRVRALKVNLCDASLRIGATESKDRGQTTSSWGTTQDMLAAVNGGYFRTSPYRPDGCVAFGGGTEWSDSNDTNYRSFLAFGPKSIGYSEAGYIETRPYTRFPWMEEAVCGDATLVFNGTAMTIANTSVRSRTGAGYSKDGKTLYLITVDERNSKGMKLTDFAKVLQRQGADFAINLMVAAQPPCGPRRLAG